MPRQNEKRETLIVSAVYLVLGTIIFLLWLYWEEVVWWFPF